MSDDKLKGQNKQASLEMSKNLASLQSDYNKLKEKYEKEYEKYQVLHNDIEEEKVRFKAVQLEVKQEKDLRVELGNKNALIKDEIAKNKQEIRYQKKLLDDIVGSYEEYQTNIHDKDVLEKELIQIRANCGTLKKGQEKYETEIARLAEKKENFLGELKKLDEDVKVESKKIEDLRDTFHVKSQEYLRTIEKLKMDKMNLDGEISAREEEIERYRGSCKYMGEKEKALKVEIEDLKFLKSKAEQDHLELQEKIEQAQVVLDELNGLRKECEEQNNVLKAIYEQKEDAEKQKLAVENDISLLEEKINRLQKTIDGKEKEVDEAQNRIDICESNLKQKNIEYEDLAEQVQLEKNNLQGVVQEISNKQHALELKTQDLDRKEEESKEWDVKKEEFYKKLESLKKNIEIKTADLKELSQKCSDMEIPLQRLNDQLAEKERALELQKELEIEAMKRLEDLRVECLNYEKMIASEETRINNIRDKKHEKQNELNDLINHAQAKAAELNALNQKYEEARIQQDALEDAKDKVRADLSRLEEAKERCDGHVREKQTILEDMGGRVKAIQTKLAALQEDYKNEQIRFDVLSNKCETSIIEKRVLEDEKEKIKAGIIELKSEIEKYKNMLAEAKTMCERENARLENYKRSNTIKELEVKAVIDELEKKREELSTVERDRDEQKERLMQLQTKTREYQNLIKEHEKQIESLQLQMANLSRDKKIYMDESATIKSAIQNLINEEGYYQEKVHKLKIRLETFRKQCDTWNKRAMEKEAVFKRHEEEIKKLGELLENKKEALVKMQNENLNYEQERQTLMSRIDVASRHLRTLEEHKVALMKRIDKYKKMLNHGVAKKVISDMKSIYTSNNVASIINRKREELEKEESKEEIKKVS